MCFDGIPCEELRGDPQFDLMVERVSGFEHFLINTRMPDLRAVKNVARNPDSTNALVKPATAPGIRRQS